MKKFFFALLLLLPFLAHSERRVYIELLGQQKSMFSTKVKVTVDFGQSTSFWRGTKGQQLVSEDGKDMNFNSMVDAMNYLGQYGWKFAASYVVTVKDWGSSNVYHWLLYKDIIDDDELYEGLLTADLFKASQPQKEKYIVSFVKKKPLATTWDVVKEQTLNVTKEDLQEIIDEWKAQSNSDYDYDCKIKKEK